ncbi:unnamed protein product [Linum trigynum]|uniref:Uncharacterized protein n=1 Tax=Linum trigynum TaxID=586398 RepID=A0AAV2GAR6_9ROSI
MSTGQTCEKNNCEAKQNSIPVALTKGMKAELISDLSSIHGIRKILLVCKNKENSIPQLILHIGQGAETGRLEMKEQASIMTCENLAQRNMYEHTSFNMRWSSSLASTTRSRSLLSTTKISPWVFWK